jgi:hypothetical protein
MFVRANRLKDTVLDSAASRISVYDRTLARQTDPALNSGGCHANLLLHLPHFVVNSADSAISPNYVQLRSRLGHILVNWLHHRHGLLSGLRH